MTDIEKFIQSLGFGKEPLQKIRHFVKEVDKRRPGGVASVDSDKDTANASGAEDAEGTANVEGATETPSSLEIFLADELRAAGIFDLPPNMPPLRAAVLSKSHMIYIAMMAPRVSQEAKEAVLRIENALNRALFVERATQQGFILPTATPEDYYLFNTRLEKNIAMQLNVLNPTFRQQQPNLCRNLTGEWDVRHALANALEEFSLPYRLTGDFRVNVDEGVIALEIEALSPDVLATNVIEEGALHTRQRSSADKEAAATEMLGREILMCAMTAATLSSEVTDIWIKGFYKDAKQHTCLITAKLSADALLKLTIEDFADPFKTLRHLGAEFNLQGRTLSPIKPSFSLRDPVLCPDVRKESPELSSRTFTEEQARVLGTQEVSGLAINEGGERARVAEKIVRNLGSSTQQNVEMIMELTKNADDEHIKRAGEDLSEKLIEGELSEEDWGAMLEEFQEGDELSRAVKRALQQVKEGKGAEILREIQRLLQEIDDAHSYDDTDTVVWRSFGSYADRVLYNRLLGDNREVKLVPNAYYLGHLLCVVGLLQQKDPEHALLHALRACEINPFDGTARLHCSKAYEQLNDLQMAASTMQDVLQYAHHPEVVALACYRLAFLVWQMGDTTLADALYRQAIRLPSPIATMAQMELVAMESQTHQEPVDDDDIRPILKEHGIPLPPVKEVGDVLVEAAKATVDAEVFLAAADICALVGILSSDDAIVDVAKSIAHEVL